MNFFKWDKFKKVIKHLEIVIWFDETIEEPKMKKCMWIVPSQELLGGLRLAEYSSTC
jgi:hypothetical protein